jgi:hypothetical protein
LACGDHPGIQLRGESTQSPFDPRCSRFAQENMVWKVPIPKKINTLDHGKDVVFTERQFQMIVEEP